MTLGRKPCGLASFRTDPDGQCWATLVLRQQGQGNAKTVEVPCPKGVLKMMPHMQEEWARMEAEKRDRRG
ncbi:hypothetical protein GCM10011335_35280 [Aureimonas glaciei]|jgi:hypothetical protein|uniref:Uncharacterized protein n=1 Tax=Aureimonas glaciei TaxID=1776957 RepID=A0A916Y2V0_9HYPH|nr:hypothetical protein GCM10011335_35280 [Aureimonas glaciei]